MTAWDMARLASKRPLRKPYKPVAPVGPQNHEHMKLVDMNPIVDRMTHVDFRACKCGYIVCSCERQATTPITFTAPADFCLPLPETEHAWEHGQTQDVPSEAFTLADGAKAFAEYNFPERSPREHGQTAPDISSGTAFTLKPAAEFVPHAYMRMGSEFRWDHRIYVNPNDPRVRSAPSEGP